MTHYTSISPLTPGWMSGFEEPRTPDFYSRTISFPLLNGKEHALIVLRKAITFPDKQVNFTPSDFERTYNVKALGCAVITHKPTLTADQSFLTTMEQLYALGTWKYSGARSQPLKTKLNPDDPAAQLAPNEVEATLEARCQDVKCTKLSMSQLEVRKGH